MERKEMMKPLAPSHTVANVANNDRSATCIDPVVGGILSGWRYDISGLSPNMRTDYEQHLTDCGHCRHRQRTSRTIDVLLITVSTLSIAAFLLAAIVIHRLEAVAHISKLHVHVSQAHAVAISLEAVAIVGVALSTLIWILVAIATPLPGFLGEIVQQKLPEDLRDRFTKAA